MASQPKHKAATGIEGLDDILSGGLEAGTRVPA